MVQTEAFRWWQCDEAAFAECVCWVLWWVPSQVCVVSEVVSHLGSHVWKEAFTDSEALSANRIHCNMSRPVCGCVNRQRLNGVRGGCWWLACGPWLKLLQSGHQVILPPPSQARSCCDRGWVVCLKMCLIKRMGVSLSLLLLPVGPVAFAAACYCAWFSGLLYSAFWGAGCKAEDSVGSPGCPGTVCLLGDWTQVVPEGQSAMLCLGSVCGHPGQNNFYTWS